MRMLGALERCVDILFEHERYLSSREYGDMDIIRNAFTALAANKGYRAEGSQLFVTKGRKETKITLNKKRDIFNFTIQVKEHGRWGNFETYECRTLSKVVDELKKAVQSGGGNASDMILIYNAFFPSNEIITSTTSKTNETQSSMYTQQKTLKEDELTDISNIVFQV